MKERIETQKYFTVEDCNTNPDKQYIFGDNLIFQGTAGQAIIRECKNAVGVPTKRLPSMSNKAFFSDRPDEFKKVSTALNNLNILYITGKTLVFPEDGLGTGRAMLKKKSPLIYKLIDDFLKTNFELEIQP